MKSRTIANHSLSLAVLLMLGCQGIGQEPGYGGGTYYYAVEINGVICGYSESQKQLFTEGDKAFWKVEDDVQVKMTLLGQDMDIIIRNEYTIDTVTGLYTYCKHVIKTGVTSQVSISSVSNRTVLFSAAEDQAPKEITLDEDVILDSPLASPHLIKDFVNGGQTEKKYRLFDDMSGEIVTKAYTRLGEEVLELAGTSFQSTVLDEINLTTAVKARIWINNDDGFTLKVNVAGRTIYLADESVKKQISLANWDNLLFAKVEKVIPDIQNITFMKVKAAIRSAGEWITAEGLSFPGQKFTGTVTDNFIEGVFEMESIRYKGEGAPGFPYDYDVPDSLTEYAVPGKLIESDHPDIIRETAGITAGASTAWEAAIRLSHWVSDNISGAIPGGTSAINTYRTREGECGSHSRLLAAMCRAAGIPARLSIGCMYSTYLGGSFGQHAWTEVFMGDAGWIAIDATADENDYVDAGHIRLGEGTSFNPVSMEILEYRIGSDGDSMTTSAVPEYYGYSIRLNPGNENGKKALDELNESAY